MNSPYPSFGNNDTGALEDLPRTIISKAEQQPIAAGAIVGGLVGHFLMKKKGLMGAAIGAALGAFLRSK